MVIAPVPKPQAPPGDQPPGASEELSPTEQADLDRMYAAGRDQMGYQRIQATRPQTLSVGLMDSPIGLAAWIVEKFRVERLRRRHRNTIHEGRAADQPHHLLGDGHDRIGESHLCRNAPSGRRASLPDAKVPVPMGYTKFPGDAFKPPRRWVERLYDVRRWSEVDEGGHFPALEVPALLSEEIRAFFRSLE